MIDPLRYAVRKLMLYKHASKIPTRIAPLSEVHCAIMFLDPMADDSEALVQAASRFFDQNEIKLRFLVPQKNDVNLMGMLKKKFRMDGDAPRSEDLFISLVSSPENFAAEYEARCSSAFFKVGCQEYKGGVFDLIVTPPEGGDASQSASFAAIKDYLMKIK